MTSHVWWHGTPDASFQARKIVPKDSMFRAVFMTRSPLVAAYYAGPHGVVHQYRIVSSARMLDTTEDGTPLIGSRDLEDLDAFCSRTVNGGFGRLAAEYFPSGMKPGSARWDLVLLVLGQTPELGHRALTAMGYSGFIRTEWTGWARGDRQRPVSTGTAFDHVSSMVCRFPSRPHTVAGLLDPRKLETVESRASNEISMLVATGRMASMIDPPQDTARAA
jgi:hypothetical protein